MLKDKIASQLLFANHKLLFVISFRADEIFIRYALSLNSGGAASE
jgi:hypothetical protein